MESSILDTGIIKDYDPIYEGAIMKLIIYIFSSLILFGCLPERKDPVLVAGEDGSGVLMDATETDSAPPEVAILSSDSTPPSRPDGISFSNLTATATRIHWLASTDPVISGEVNSGISFYRVLRDGSQVGNSSVLFFDDNFLTPGMSYRYQIIAVDIAGNSSPVSLTEYQSTPSIPLGPDITGPSIDSGVSISNLSSTSLQINWLASIDPTIAGDITSGLSTYNIYQNNTFIGDTSSLIYDVTGLTPGTTYSYHIIAVDLAANLSASSNIVFETTLTATPTSPSGPSEVDVLLLQGKAGRIALSCDDGLTWIHEQQGYNDGRMCNDWPGGGNCDHEPWSAQGIDFDGTWFYASWGWGAPGSILRSQDGVTWETVLLGSEVNDEYPRSWAGVAAGNGAVIAADDKDGQISFDGGATTTWTGLGDTGLMLSGSTRYIGYVPVESGVFLMAGDADSTGTPLVASTDAGISWAAPNFLGDECGVQILGAVAGDGLIVMSHATNAMCVSLDSGETWVRSDLPGSSVAKSKPAFDGENFYVWGDGERFTGSVDTQGILTWSSTDTDPGWFDPAVVLRTPTGAYVAGQSRGHGVAHRDRNYENQVMWRSDDGLTWTQLDNGSDFVGGHPLKYMISGTAPAATCP
jgi:chitodextrinase